MGGWGRRVGVLRGRGCVGCGPCGGVLIIIVDRDHYRDQHLYSRLYMICPYPFWPKTCNLFGLVPP